MSRSKKGGLLQRRKNALARIEAAYGNFRAAGKDKEPWVTTRNGKEHVHAGRSYSAECKRFADEIARLKAKIH